MHLGFFNDYVQFVRHGLCQGCVRKEKLNDGLDVNPSRILYQSHDYYRALRIIDSITCNPIERQSFLHDEWAMRFVAPDIHESRSSDGQ